MKNLRLDLTWIVWSFLAVLGCVLVFFRIGHHSLWSDEAVSIYMTNVGFTDIFRAAPYDAHPPLYYLALKTFSTVFGHSRGALRCFSALGLLATALLLGMGPVTRLFNRRTGMIFALLMLFAPLYLAQAQEIRMYTWATFLVSACITYGYLYVCDARKNDLILFALASLGGLYIHYYVTLGIFFIHLYLLIRILLSNRDRLKPFIGESLAVAFLFVPWTFILATQITSKVKDYWIEPPTVTTLVETLLVPFMSKTGYLAYSPVLMVVCVLFFIYAIYGLRKRKADSGFLALSAGVFLSVLIFVLVFSWTLRPILIPRYMLPYWGMLFMGVACGFDLLFQWRARLGKALAVMLLLLYVMLSIPYLNLLYFFQLNGPMDDVRMFAKDNFRKGQALVYFDDDVLQTFVVEFPEMTHYYFRLPNMQYYDSHNLFNGRFTTVTKLNGLKGRHDIVWLAGSPDAANYQTYREIVGSYGINAENPVLWEGRSGSQNNRQSYFGSTTRFTVPLSDFTVDLTPIRVR